MKTIRGHTCHGVKRHFQFVEGGGKGCVPRFNEMGSIDACDDKHPQKIKFCPFCGVKLESGLVKPEGM